MLRSSWAGQKHIAFSPLRLCTFNLSSTFSKSANILGVSFERVGRLVPGADQAIAAQRREQHLKPGLPPVRASPSQVGGRVLSFLGGLTFTTLFFSVPWASSAASSTTTHSPPMRSSGPHPSLGSISPAIADAHW